MVKSPVNCVTTVSGDCRTFAVETAKMLTLGQSNEFVGTRLIASLHQ